MWVLSSGSNLFQAVEVKLFKMDGGMKMKVDVTFKGSNYLVWSRMVKTDVESKLWKHITSGEAPKLITQEGDKEIVSEGEADKWQQEDMMVMSVLHA